MAATTSKLRILLLIFCILLFSVNGKISWNELPISDVAQDRLKKNWDESIDSVRDGDKVTGLNMAPGLENIAENSGISFSESPSPSATQTPTPSISPTNSPTPSSTPSTSPSETPLPSVTPTVTPTSTKSPSPTPFRNTIISPPSPISYFEEVTQTSIEFSVPLNGSESRFDLLPVLEDADEENKYEPLSVGDYATIDNFVIDGDFSGEIAPSGKQLFRERVLKTAVVRQTISSRPQVILRCNGKIIVLRRSGACAGSLLPILTPTKIEVELIQVDGRNAGINIVYKVEGPVGNLCRVLFRFEVTTRRRLRRGLLPSLSPISAPVSFSPSPTISLSSIYVSPEPSISATTSSFVESPSVSLAASPSSLIIESPSPTISSSHVPEPSQSRTVAASQSVSSRSSTSPSSSFSSSPIVSASTSMSLSASLSGTPIISPSTSINPSTSTSITPSVSPSTSESPSTSFSSKPSVSVSTSMTPSVSSPISPSKNIDPSTSTSRKPSISSSISPSSSSSGSPIPSEFPSVSATVSASESPSIFVSISASPSDSPAASSSATQSASLSVSPSPSSSNTCVSDCQCENPGVLHGDDSFDESEFSSFGTADSIWRTSNFDLPDNFFRSDPRSENVEYSSVEISMKITSENDNYFGAGIRTQSNWYGYGCVSSCMKPSSVSGVISSLFTYTSKYDGVGGSNPNHNEIDIEFEGKDTSIVQFNYYVDKADGEEQYNEKDVSLGFDASQSFNVFGFRWTPWGIEWFVNGQMVYMKANEGEKGTPIVTETTVQKVMANLWVVSENIEDFFGGSFDEDNFSGAESKYKWIRVK